MYTDTTYLLMAPGLLVKIGRSYWLCLPLVVTSFQIAYYTKIRVCQSEFGAGSW